MRSNCIVGKPQWLYGLRNVRYFNVIRIRSEQGCYALLCTVIFTYAQIQVSCLINVYNDVDDDVDDCYKCITIFSAPLLFGIIDDVFTDFLLMSEWSVV